MTESWESEFPRGIALEWTTGPARLERSGRSAPHPRATPLAAAVSPGEERVGRGPRDGRPRRAYLVWPEPRWPPAEPAASAAMSEPAPPPPPAWPPSPERRGEAATRRELRASHRLMQVTERELQRILLDIHDGPVQHMYAALSQLDLLRRALEGQGPLSPEAEDRMGRIRLLLENGLNEVRSFLGALRPPEFETRGLVALLEGLAVQHEALTDTEVLLAPRGELPEAGQPVKIALYRVLQEALSNAYRHGGATRVVVRLRRVERRGKPRLRMSVLDDGHGFDSRATLPDPDTHYGLAGMRDRIEMVGGRFRIRGAPGRGTMLVAEVPL